MDGYKAVPQHATNSSRLAQGRKVKETKGKRNRNSERTERGTGKKGKKKKKVSLNNITHHSLARFNHSLPGFLCTSTHPAGHPSSTIGLTSPSLPSREPTPFRYPLSKTYTGLRLTGQIIRGLQFVHKKNRQPSIHQSIIQTLRRSEGKKKTQRKENSKEEEGRKKLAKPPASPSSSSPSWD
jgi:hypothetical protein